MRNIQLILLISIGVVILFGAFLIANFRGEGTNSEDIQVDNTSSGEIAPHYVEYSSANLAKAKSAGRAVIYFWASWCPTCKVLDKELRERGNELPNDVTVLKTNYDTEKELKKKYQIVQQHTLVQVDSEGNEINKWIGGNIDIIKQQLK